MGGGGSKSMSASARGRGIAAQAAQQQAAPSPQAVTVPTQAANQPTLTLGATTDLTTLQAMTPQQFAQYMAQQQAAPNPMSAVLYDSPVQRMIYDAGINDMPAVVSESQLSKMPGTTLYRTVNSTYDAANDVNHPADQIARQTMQSAFNRIGGGVYGDGHYFDTTRGGSTSYGHTRGDVTKTAVMKAKLDPNAKVVQVSRLKQMLRSEPKALRDAMSVPNRRGGYTSSDNNLSAYALYKGYDVIQTRGGYHVVINRSVLTFSSKIAPK